MAKVKLREKTTEEWLKQRLGSIGSSDAGAVCGLNKYKSNVDVYAEKVADEPEDVDTLDTRLGTKMEDPIAELFMEDHNLTLEKDPYIRYHDDYDFLSCNVDRIVKEEDVPAEIKMKSTWNGEIPDWEFAQIQHQMFIFGVDFIFYIVLVTGFNRRLEYHIYDRNDAFIEDMLQDEVAFWRNVQDRIPPQPKTYDEAKKIFTHTSEQIATATGEDVRLLKQAVNTKEHVKELEGQYDQLKAQIAWMLKQDGKTASEILRFGDEEVATWQKTKPSTRFNKKQFKKDHPDLYKQYLEEREGYRRLLLKANTINDIHRNRLTD